jgi:hypothetical protein
MLFVSRENEIYYNFAVSCMFIFTDIYASDQQVLRSFDIEGIASLFPYYVTSTLRNEHANIRWK